MRLGRVMGQVVSTQKHQKLEGAKLLLVQLVSANAEPIGSPILTIDAAQAGPGDTVLVVLEGRAAVSALRRRAAPVDAAIIGVVDRVDTESESASGRWGLLPRKSARARRR